MGKRRSAGGRMFVVALSLPFLLLLLSRRGKSSSTARRERDGDGLAAATQGADSPPARAPLQARRRAVMIGPLLLVFLFLVGAALGAGYSAMAEDGVATDSGVSAASSSSTTGDTTTAETTTAETTTAETTTAETTTAETTTTDAPTETGSSATTEPIPPDGSSTAPAAGEPGASSPPHSAPPPPAESDDEASAPSGADPAPPTGPGPVIEPSKHAERAAETNEGGAATIWLHRALPDPTPPAKRLAPAFARQLRLVSSQADVHWSLVLAVLRAAGHGGRVPAGLERLERLAGRLAADPHAVLGDGLFAEHVRALARFNRAVGLRALVIGLEAAKYRLEERILNDARVDIYPGGRADIASGLVDVRVLVLIRYLKVTFGQVTVSSLHSGHPMYARPGMVSAHVYGLAVDISALHWTPITGHQQPGSITERAVEAVMRLPAEVQAQQVISLLGLGGASLALGDHYDHIHVGF